MESRMEFMLLGPFEVRADCGVVSLGGTKQRAVLALLLLNANRVVTREELIDGLWGENPPETAAKVILVYVSRLRKVMAHGALVTKPRGYLVEVEKSLLDLERFEGLLEDAKAADVNRAADLLRQALSLWRGPALAEFDEPFARPAAVRLEALRLTALEDRIRADLACGRHAELSSEVAALAAKHPHRERFRAQLMLALYRSGRHAEALAAFRDARAALDEVGLEPSAALRQLEKQILTQDNALDLAPTRTLLAKPGSPLVLPSPLVSEPQFPFVGRVKELATLRALLEQARQGRGGLVLLGGEAGGGKTRLLREAAHEAAGNGALVVYGSSDAVVRTPYEPLREWLEFLLSVCDAETLRASLGEGRHLLARLVPGLAQSAEPAPTSGDQATDRFLLQRAAAELLTGLSRLRPLVLIADDIHWADTEMLHLLRRLARSVPGSGIVLVAAFRDRGESTVRELDETLNDLSRLDGAVRLSLQHLEHSELETFIRTGAKADASDALVAAVAGLTSGSPLLLCELWRHLIESGTVEIIEGVAVLTRPLNEVRGPGRVRTIVRQRLSRLAPETVAVLELAAVAGSQFELDVIVEGSGVDRPSLIAAVEQAIDHGIIEELPHMQPTCRFSHELVRRAIYDRISRVRRAELHLQVGIALERAHAPDLAPVFADLAHHFTLAAPIAGVEPGVDYNLRAAEVAVSAVAFDDGVANLRTALELGIADPQRRARTQIELAYLLRETMHRTEATQILAEVLEDASGRSDEQSIVAVKLRRLGAAMGEPHADPAEMRAQADEVMEIFREIGDRARLAQAGRGRALSLRREGRLAAAAAQLEEALVIANASGDPVARREIIGTLVYAMCDGPMPVGQAARRCHELLETNSPDTALAATIRRCLGLLSAMSDDLQQAREHIEQSSRTLDGLSYNTQSSIYRVIAAEARELIGDRAGAERELQAKLAEARQWDSKGPDARAMHAAYHLALVYCDAGRWDAAEQCLAYGADVPPVHYFLHENVLRLAASARVEGRHGRHVKAVELARRAVAIAERSDFLNLRARTWLALAEVQERRRASAEAEAARRAAATLYRAKGNVAALRLMHTAPNVVRKRAEVQRART
jgi:DNA-binding SARP family transcriptional activator